MTPSEMRHTGGVKAASTIALLAGIWFFVSPWVYGAYTNPNAWNSWIVGAVIAILAASRLANPSVAWMSWLNCLLGIWAFVSPWVYGYTDNTGRFINSLCVGVVVFIMAITSMNRTVHTEGDMPHRI